MISEEAVLFDQQYYGQRPWAFLLIVLFKGNKKLLITLTDGKSVGRSYKFPKRKYKQVCTKKSAPLSIFMCVQDFKRNMAYQVLQ